MDDSKSSPKDQCSAEPLTVLRIEQMQPLGRQADADGAADRRCVAAEGERLQGGAERAHMQDGAEAGRPHQLDIAPDAGFRRSANWDVLRPDADGDRRAVLCLTWTTEHDARATLQFDC